MPKKLNLTPEEMKERLKEQKLNWYRKNYTKLPSREEIDVYREKAKMFDQFQELIAAIISQ